jgi:hypothetical protein|tara:strand:+ start:2479 stop:2991 length:513 start_codon:yes stop_codon:yes gene_type:complete
MSSKEDLEVIRAIGQAAANAYDGALDDKGEPVVVGLSRDVGNPTIDSRIVDGFKVKMVGEKLMISYQSDVFLKDVHDKNFENDLERKMGDIVSYLKKEFKKITKKALNLKSLGDVDALVQQTSRVRVFVVATKTYEVGNLSSVDAVEGDTTVKNINRNFQDFLAEGAWKA